MEAMTLVKIPNSKNPRKEFLTTYKGGRVMKPLEPSNAALPSKGEFADILSPLHAITHLLQQHATTKQQWDEVATMLELNLSNVSKDELRSLILESKMYQRVECESVILAIIKLRIPHLEDYDEMAEQGLCNDPWVKWEIGQAVYEAAKSFFRLDYGKQIYDKIFPPFNYSPYEKNEVFFHRHPHGIK